MRATSSHALARSGKPCRRTTGSPSSEPWSRTSKTNPPRSTSDTRSLIGALSFFPAVWVALPVGAPRPSPPPMVRIMAGPCAFDTAERCPGGTSHRARSDEPAHGPLRLVSTRDDHGSHGPGARAAVTATGVTWRPLDGIERRPPVRIHAGCPTPNTAAAPARTRTRRGPCRVRRPRRCLGRASHGPDRRVTSAVGSARSPSRVVSRRPRPGRWVLPGREFYD